MVQSDTGRSADIFIRITLKLGRLYSDSKSALKMENSWFLREIDGQRPWTRPLAQVFVDYYARRCLFDLANFDDFTIPNRTNDPHRLAGIYNGRPRHLACRPRSCRPGATELE